jgi:predicted RNase H-like nuclease
LPDRGRGRLFCGLDGAIARASKGEGGAELRLGALPRFADVLCAAEAPAMIAVDIPIGLPAKAGRGGPAAERRGWHGRSWPA